MIEPDIYRDATARDVDALVAACDDLEAVVPACPGWTVRDLLRHLGKVQRWATSCLQLEPGVERARPRGPGEGVDPRSWFLEGARALLDVLETADLTRPVHTWAGERPGSWWVRRLTHETAVHRWDAQAAAGHPEGFAADLAGDGIDEYFDEFVGAFADLSSVGAVVSTMGLRAVDIDNRWWRVEFGNGKVRVDSAPQRVDVAVSAPAGDLFLLLWHRRPLDGLDVVGDPPVVARWQQVVVV